MLCQFQPTVVATLACSFSSNLLFYFLRFVPIAVRTGVVRAFPVQVTDMRCEVLGRGYLSDLYSTNLSSNAVYTAADRAYPRTLVA